VAKLHLRFDDAHRAWLQEVVTQVLPKRVAACEVALDLMGFTMAPPPPPPPLPTGYVETPLQPWQQDQAAALEAKRKKAALLRNEKGDNGEEASQRDGTRNASSDRKERSTSSKNANDDDNNDDDDSEELDADEADFNAILPPLPLGPHWTALDVARGVRRRLPSKSMSPNDTRRVAGALFGVNCDGEAVRKRRR